MAKFKAIGVDEFIDQLARLGAKNEQIARLAVGRASLPLAAAVKENLRKVLKNSKTSTGDLESALGITPVKDDKDGTINIKIGFDGYDRNGTPQPLKAAVLESGMSRMKKSPFIRPAVNKTKKQVLEILEKTIDEETKKIMGG